MGLTTACEFYSEPRIPIRPLIDFSLRWPARWVAGSVVKSISTRGRAGLRARAWRKENKTANCSGEPSLLLEWSGRERKTITRCVVIFALAQSCLSNVSRGRQQTFITYITFAKTLTIHLECRVPLRASGADAMIPRQCVMIIAPSRQKPVQLAARAGGGSSFQLEWQQVREGEGSATPHKR